MLPDIPPPRASLAVRSRNEGRPAQERCAVCEAPLVGQRFGVNYSNARNVIMDPAKPYEPDSGTQWVGASCARKIPAGYLMPGA